MTRDQVVWTLIAFFGASVAFRGIIDATEGESFWLTFGLQVVAFVLIVGVITLIVRRRR